MLRSGYKTATFGIFVNVWDVKALRWEFFPCK